MTYAAAHREDDVLSLPFCRPTRRFNFASPSHETSVVVGVEEVRPARLLLSRRRALNRHQPRLRLLRPLPSSPEGAAVAVAGRSCCCREMPPPPPGGAAAAVAAGRCRRRREALPPVSLRFRPDFLPKITEEEYLFTEEDNLYGISN